MNELSPVVHRLMQAGSFQSLSVHRPRQTPLLSLGMHSPFGSQVSSSAAATISELVLQHMLEPDDLQGRNLVVLSSVPLGQKHAADAWRVVKVKMRMI